MDDRMDNVWTVNCFHGLSGWIICGQVTVFMDDRMDNVWTGKTFHG